MPRTLFDQSIASRATNTRPFGTVLLSIALHAGALAILVVLQLTSSIHPLDVISPLTAYVAPPATPVPPPVRTLAPAAAPTAPVIRTAPAVEPESISTEPPIVATAVGAAPIPGLTVGQPGDVRSLLSSGSEVPMSLPPPPVPTGPVRIGGQVRAPARLVYVAPDYPSFARSAKVEGEVVLEAAIDATGAIRDVVVRRSIPVLDRAAVDAVKQWRYAPTELNGVAVAVIMEIRVRFSLR